MVAILFGSKVASADLDPIVIKVCSMPCIPLVKNEEGSSKLTSYLKGSKFFFSSNGTQLQVVPISCDLFLKYLSDEISFMKGIAYQRQYRQRDTSLIKLSFSEYTFNRGLFNQWHDQWWHQVYRSTRQCGHLRSRHPALTRASDKYHPSLRYRSEAGPLEVYAVTARRWDLSYRRPW